MDDKLRIYMILSLRSITFAEAQVCIMAFITSREYLFNRTLIKLIIKF